MKKILLILSIFLMLFISPKTNAKENIGVTDLIKELRGKINTFS